MDKRTRVRFYPYIIMLTFEKFIYRSYILQKRNTKKIYRNLVLKRTYPQMNSSIFDQLFPV